MPETGHPRLHVVIAYDSRANAGRGMRLVDGLARQFPEDLVVHRDLWRFDVLGLPGARETALEESMTADLLIVAAAGGRELPESVSAWLHAWSERHLSDKAALVALLETAVPNPTRVSPVRGLLEALAAHAGIEFFSREFSVPAVPFVPAISGLEDIRHRAGEITPVLQGILNQVESIS